MTPSSDLESSFREFIDLATDPDPPHDRLAREGILGEKIAEMIDALPSNERRYWIGKLLGVVAGATEGSRQSALRPSRN